MTTRYSHVKQITGMNIVSSSKYTLRCNRAFITINTSWVYLFLSYIYMFYCMSHIVCDNSKISKICEYCDKPCTFVLSEILFGNNFEIATVMLQAYTEGAVLRMPPLMFLNLL